MPSQVSANRFGRAPCQHLEQDLIYYSKDLIMCIFHLQYIDGEKSFILEIKWGPTYPTDKPSFNLNIFYNQSL